MISFLGIAVLAAIALAAQSAAAQNYPTKPIRSSRPIRPAAFRHPGKVDRPEDLRRLGQPGMSSTNSALAAIIGTD